MCFVTKMFQRNRKQEKMCGVNASSCRMQKLYFNFHFVYIAVVYYSLWCCTQPDSNGANTHLCNVAMALGIQCGKNEGELQRKQGWATDGTVGLLVQEGRELSWHTYPMPRSCLSCFQSSVLCIWRPNMNHRCDRFQASSPEATFTDT